MEKIKRNFDVSYLFDWSSGVELSRLKKDIEELEKLGATHIDMSIEPVAYGCFVTEFKAVSFRLETDEEYQYRIDEQTKYEQYRKELSHRIFDKTK